MKKYTTLLLSSFIVIFFISCEDVNTLCPPDEDNKTIDVNTTNPDDDITIPEDDNETDSDKPTNPTNPINPISPTYPIYPDFPDYNDSVPDENSTIPPDDEDQNDTNETTTYTKHKNINSEIFWIGQDDDNSSAWDNNWRDSYGGIDTPDSRDEYNPEAFTPNENPFYVALPYNDLDSSGNRKSDVELYIPWASQYDPQNESICKNRWIKISANRKDAYGQWEDVGPNGDNNKEYVFGEERPSYIKGISLSPAIRDYLGIDENSSIDWEFVEQEDVPDGPWLDIITISNSNI